MYLEVVLTQQFQLGHDLRLTVLDVLEQRSQLGTVPVGVPLVLLAGVAQYHLQHRPFLQQLADEVAAVHIDVRPDNNQNDTQ